MYIPTPSPRSPASQEALELGERLEHVIRSYLEHHPATSSDDIQHALDIAGEATGATHARARITLILGVLMLIGMVGYLLIR